MKIGLGTSYPAQASETKPCDRSQHCRKHFHCHHRAQGRLFSCAVPARNHIDSRSLRRHGLEVFSRLPASSAPSELSNYLCEHWSVNMRRSIPLAIGRAHCFARLAKISGRGFMNLVWLARPSLPLRASGVYH